MSKRMRVTIGAVTALMSIAVLGASAVAYDERQPGALPERGVNVGSGATPIATSQQTRAPAWMHVSANAIVHGILADPRNASRLFAATTRGFMRSVDTGKSWTIVHRGLPSVDPALWAIAFFDTDRAIAAAGDSSRLYVSRDLGLHWKPEASALGNAGIYALAVDPGDSRIMLAGANGGIWRTVDAGARWSLVHGVAGRAISALAWAGTSSATVFAGVTPGPTQILESTNRGLSWRAADAGFKGDEGIMALEASGSGSGDMLAGTMGHRVWRASLTSLTWNPSAAGLPAGSHGAALLSGAGHVWLGTMGNGIYTSGDGGRSWAPYGPPLTGVARIVLSLIATDRALLAGTAQGIYRLALEPPK